MKRLTLLCAVALLSACTTPLTPAQQSQITAGTSAAITLGTIAAQNSTTAASLVTKGALICGKIDSTTGQLATAGLTAVADAFGLAAVTNVADGIVGTVCPSIGLVAGALPSGVDPSTLPVTTTSVAQALPSVAVVPTN